MLPPAHRASYGSHERSRFWPGVRRALVLVVHEVVDAILLDRAAPGRRQLLVGVRQDFLLDEVGRVELVVAEVAGERTGCGVGAGLRDGVHLDAGGTALPRVEAVGDHLELGDRVLAETRLAEAGGDELRDLLPVNVQLKAGGRRLGDEVLAAAGGKQRQIHEVAPVDGQIRDLQRVDVAAQVRLRRVDERRFAGDRHRLLQRGGRHLQVERNLLTDLHLHAAAFDARKTGELRGDAVLADADWDQVLARAVRDGFETIAVGFVDGAHDHARQHAAGLIGNRAADRRFLSEGGHRQ